MADSIPDSIVSPAITNLEPGRRVPRPSAAGIGATNLDNNRAYGPARATSPSYGDQFPLPPELAKDYEVIRLLGAGSEADVFLVHNRETGDKRVAKVYRPGTPERPGPQPNPEVLERTQRDKSPHLVRVEKYRIDDVRSWELQEFIESSLEDVLAGMSKPVPSAWVREFLALMNPALEYLHSLEIEHRDLKPSNILVRTRKPLSIVISDFGIASVTKTTLHATNRTACTPEYAPPESVAGSGILIARTRWDYWSLGMMIVELLTGRHPLLNGWATDGVAERDQWIQNRLINANTDDFVARVSDPHWKNLCRGLLRRDANLRWGSKEVGRWLVNPTDKRLTVAQETAPSNAARAAQSIRFLGKDHTQPETLAEAFAANWEKAADYWRRDASYLELHHWLTHELGALAHAEVLGAVRKSSQPLDAQLFAAIQTLSPERTPSFQGEALTPQNLQQLADTVRTSQSAVGKWLALERNRILQIAGQKHPNLAAIDQAQQQALAAYTACRKLVHDNAHTTIATGDLSDRDRAFLLASVVPGTTVLAQEGGLLRTEIMLVGQTESLGWVRLFDGIPNAQAAAMVLVPALAAAATAETEQMQTLSAFRVAQAFCITLAALPVAFFLVWLLLNILDPLSDALKLFLAPSTLAMSLFVSFVGAAIYDQYQAHYGTGWKPFLFLDPKSGKDSSVATAIGCAAAAILSIGLWTSIAALVVLIVKVVFFVTIAIIALALFSSS